jgi:hypothetical protein
MDVTIATTPQQSPAKRCRRAAKLEDTHVTDIAAVKESSEVPVCSRYTTTWAPVCSRYCWQGAASILRTRGAINWVRMEDQKIIQRASSTDFDQHHDD